MKFLLGYSKILKTYSCTPPFEAVGGGCYYYSSDVGITVDSYAVAETLCTAEGGHLGYVKTGDENTAIVDHFFGTSSKHRHILLILIHRKFNIMQYWRQRLSKIISAKKRIASSTIHTDNLLIVSLV